MIKTHVTAIILFISVSLFGQTKMIISKYDGTVDSLELSNIKNILFKIDTVSNPITGQLIAYYPLNGNADDSSGNGYNGLAVQTKPDSNRFGVDSSAISFNGYSSYVFIPFEFDYPQKTISFWFYADTIDNETRNIYVSDNPNLKYGLSKISIQNINGNNTLFYQLSNVTYETIITKPKEWHFVAMVISNKSYSFYLDGNMIKSGTFSNYLTSVNGLRSTILGSARNLTTYFFSGVIDELRIYNKVLTSDQIQLLYKGN